MTQQHLGHDLAFDTAPDDNSPGTLGTLFESSPSRVVSTSAAAETAFVLGLLAALAAPFSLAMAVCLAAAAVALVSSIVGMARASRPDVAGGLLASLGMVLAVTTLVSVGLRYVGVETAFGDAMAPTLADWLAALNALLPAP